MRFKRGIPFGSFFLFFSYVPSYVGELKAMLGFTVDSRFWAHLSETFINIAFFKKEKKSFTFIYGLFYYAFIPGVNK